MSLIPPTSQEHLLAKSLIPDPPSPRGHLLATLLTPPRGHLLATSLDPPAPFAHTPRVCWSGLR